MDPPWKWLNRPFFVWRGQLVGYGVSQCGVFPPEVSPLVADSSADLVGGAVVNIGVPVDRGVTGEDLEASVPGGNPFRGGGVTESIPSAEAVVGLFDFPADPVAVEHVRLRGECGK